MFDGEGFVRGVLRKGRKLAGARVLVVGSGGVGSAIVASLAKAGVAELALFDAHAAAMNGLAERLRAHYPALKVEVGSNDPAGLRRRRQRHSARHEGRRPAADGCRPHCAVDLRRRSRDEGRKSRRSWPRRRARGCEFQIGTDMLFEQIPAYLEFFGFRTTTPEELREVAQISY